jgi:hypothetical protein
MQLCHPGGQVADGFFYSVLFLKINAENLAGREEWPSFFQG